MIFRKKKVELPKERQITVKDAIEYLGWRYPSRLYYWIDKGVITRYRSLLGQVRLDINEIKEVERMTRCL